MKKLLALILSVIMVLSMMPMAYAQRATYSPEIEEYIELYLRVVAYVDSTYESYEQKIKVRTIVNEFPVDVVISEPDYEWLITLEADGRLEEIANANEHLKKLINEIEKKINDGELALVIDFYEFFKYAWGPDFYYSDEALDEINNRIQNFNSDKFNNIKDEFKIARDKVNEIFQASLAGECYAYTQDDFDAAMGPVKTYVNLVFACLDGDHPYGEYISDNNATEDADGTKTATCEFCGATDTIVDEGTKLPKEEATLYEMIFDLIKSFFELIISIFA
jgi:hypothetical protein